MQLPHTFPRGGQHARLYRLGCNEPFQTIYAMLLAWSAVRANVALHYDCKLGLLRMCLWSWLGHPLSALAGGQPLIGVHLAAVRPLMGPPLSSLPSLSPFPPSTVTD